MQLEIRGRVLGKRWPLLVGSPSGGLQTLRGGALAGGPVRRRGIFDCTANGLYLLNLRRLGRLPRSCCRGWLGRRGRAGYCWRGRRRRLLPQYLRVRLRQSLGLAGAGLVLGHVDRAFYRKNRLSRVEGLFFLVS